MGDEQTTPEAWLRKVFVGAAGLARTHDIGGATALSVRDAQAVADACLAGLQRCVELPDGPYDSEGPYGLTTLVAQVPTTAADTLGDPEGAEALQVAPESPTARDAQS